MSGADLSNLINEAALIAVRNSEDAISAEHFEAARDRTLMGQKRESMALTAAEKEAIAYHEADMLFAQQCFLMLTRFIKSQLSRAEWLWV